ncbi:related to protoplast regeneration and killer toxin resistance protein [Rhynchosporium agropyri]|uniref:Related to protoplast regeneration and killer toxin resistance protein n=1 Tax=Rhynchosporium agropyri TaxID=914238 RepID=A0A1E1KJV8_9HELO|nr:related to protoplast regeneration and killer toxin resistance protein [Rhynchosporium agropyri]
MESQAFPGSPPRNPQPITTSPRFVENSEHKENGGSPNRKALPQIPLPASGRMHGAPMSPVKINVQREDWPPRSSVATIEEGNANFPQESERYNFAQYDRAEPQMPIVQGIPFRPAYDSPKGTQSQQKQAPVLSPGAAVRSRTPSDEIRRRGGYGTVDEKGHEVEVQAVPRLQYYHQSHNSEGGVNRNRGQFSPYGNDLVDVGQSINRHLTPTSQVGRSTPLQRPLSTYSDMGPRGRSPGSPNWGGRAPSAHSGRSNDNRPLSCVDLANMSYPQAPPPPISMDNSQLRSVVGTNASLLSMAKTLEMYRQNVKKLNDSETQYAFAIFLIQAAQESGLSQDGDASSGKASPRPGNRDLESPYIEKPQASPQELLTEAKHMLQKLSDRSYPFAQYYLADGYASGLFSKGKEDYSTAFPLFVAASKHGHAESGYRAALCYEFGWGCRKDPAKAVQYYRQSASKNHPGAMTRLGRACLSGDLGMNKYREGLKWLKRATDSADIQYNAAPYHLGLLYETGYGDDVFQDEVYAAQLFTQAADLGHPEACYRLGDSYEHGKLSCPRDPALSVHFYTGAAQKGHSLAMMALCAWYMVGAEPVLEKDENEAYEWARQAAESGLTKAEYAVGYFTEMGIGTRRDPLEANVWYVKAAESGDERAKHRLAAIRAAASGGTQMEVAPPRNANGAKIKKNNGASEKSEKDCVVM